MRRNRNLSVIRDLLQFPEKISEFSITQRLLSKLLLTYSSVREREEITHSLSCTGVLFRTWKKILTSQLTMNSGCEGKTVETL